MDFSILILIACFLVLFALSLLPIIVSGILIRRKLEKKLKYVLVISLSLIQLWIFYSVFVAFYPEDSFYMEEYKHVTGFSPPPSANVVKKSASYPNLHGDYCSAAIMELSVSDYQKLYRKTALDQSYSNADLTYSDTLDEVLTKEQQNNIIQVKKHHTNEQGQACFVAFFKDGKSILIYFINS